MSRPLLAVPILAILLPAGGQELKRPAILGISHVTLRAVNLDQSRRFYAGVLGLRKEPAALPSASVQFRINRRQFIRLVAAPPDAPRDRLVEIGFHTNGVDAMRHYLSPQATHVPNHT